MSVNMQLPICKGTYSSDVKILNVDFLCKFKQFIDKYTEENHPFFVGLCYCCHIFGSRSEPLIRCSGCQLVGYCSRECQKKDWDIHKYVCKEFPVTHGKNALQTRDCWKEHISGLRERASRLPHADLAAKPIFQNPRVCNNCREARPARLTDCQCACVSYCSDSCSKSDRLHKQDCDSLYDIALSYAYCYENDLPSLRDVSVCNSYTPVSELEDIIPSVWASAFFEMLDSKKKGGVHIESFLFNERMSYPMSLLYALQDLPELGPDKWSLEDLTTLTVHVITSSPLLDSEPWEVFMHRLPTLKQLNVVFVMQGNAFKNSFHTNNELPLSLLRCKDCQAKNRIITYSVHQMKYHMFFSSIDYTEPDVVVIYGNTHEMPVSVDEDVHSDISYGNMTSVSHTVLVLTDATKDLVIQGVNAVYLARPIEQLVTPQINKLSGYSSDRNDIDSDDSICNDRHYFACLRKKDISSTEEPQYALNIYWWILVCIVIYVGVYKNTRF